MMLIVSLLSAVLQVGQFEGVQRDIGDVLRITAGVFALVLSLLSLYAWSRRRQPALLIVSSAFLLFFLKQAVWLLSDVYDIGPIDFLLVTFDFIILTLFFVAIILRPRRQRERI